MAVTARQVEFAQQGDVRVGRVVDHVVDSNTGLVAERERIAVQVPTEHGGTATVIGERIRAVHVPHWIHDSGRFPALTSGGGGGSSGRGGNVQGESEENPCALCTCFCLLCFLPFTASKICVGILGFVVLVAVAVLTSLTAVGPVHCHDLIPASGTTLALLGVILLIALLCCCFACVGTSEQEGGELIRACLYCCNCVVAVLFVGLVISSSALVFANPALQAVTSGNCYLAAAPIATVAFSYALCLLFSVFWCCACCYLLSSN